MNIIKIHGILVDMLLDIAPDIYGPYVEIGQEGSQTKYYKMHECHIWNHVEKSTLLL